MDYFLRDAVLPFLIKKKSCSIQNGKNYKKHSVIDLEFGGLNLTALFIANLAMSQEMCTKLVVSRQW